MPIKVLLFLAQVALTIGLINALVRSLLRWKLDLYGQAAFKPLKGKSLKRPFYAYTFAIRNAEDATLIAPFAIELALEKEGTRFGHDELAQELPAIYCGFGSRHAGSRVEYRTETRDPGTACEANNPSSKAVFIIDVERLLPRETWVIRFGTSASSRHVAMRIRRRGEFPQSHPWLPLVHNRELRLDDGREQGHVLTAQVFRTWVLAVAFMLLLYLFPILNSDVPVIPWRWLFSPFHAGDLLVLLGLPLVALLVYRANRYEPTPFVQGYSNSGTEPQPPAPKS